MADEDKTVNLTPERLHELIKNKLILAGLPEEQAEETAKHLVYADMIGVHSHGAVRVEYYSERISKGGINTQPDLFLKRQDRAQEFFMEIMDKGTLL